MNWLDEGKQPREIYEDCPECGGMGYHITRSNKKTGFAETRLCRECDGTGRIEKRPIDRGDEERDNKEYFNNLNKE